MYCPGINVECVYLYIYKQLLPDTNFSLPHNRVQPFPIDPHWVLDICSTIDVKYGKRIGLSYLI